ncbi:hypothetical protein [Cellulosimicrobium sp. NPDC055967]|uniref:hypothetical protein n=1 Tax=Cellulosimicrobium sp. NPDC055967 TaxID=3345670 RepID=UPI0035D87EC4
MELREWLPLVVSGVLGLAGIIAGLWGTLANLRAQDRRDKRAAAERSEQADRDIEAARRAHLLDERRVAYAELATVAGRWVDKLIRRGTNEDELTLDRSLSHLGPIGRSDTLWHDSAAAFATVRVVGRAQIGYEAQALETELRALDAGDGWSKSTPQRLSDLQATYELLVYHMQEDLSSDGA